MRSLGIHPNQQQHMRVCLASARPENSTHAFRSARMHAISLDLSGQLPLRKFRIECNLQQCDAQFTVVVLVVSCCPTPHPFRLPPVPQSRWHSDSATANRSPRLFSLYGAVLVVIARPNASACVCAHTHTFSVRILKQHAFCIAVCARLSCLANADECLSFPLTFDAE